MLLVRAQDTIDDPSFGSPSATATGRPSPLGSTPGFNDPLQSPYAGGSTPGYNNASQSPYAGGVSPLGGLGPPNKYQPSLQACAAAMDSSSLQLIEAV